MGKEAYLERARQEVERARERIADYAGDCSDCRWSRKGGWLDGLICAHPGVIAVAFNVTDAYDKKQIKNCTEQRDKESIYGPVICGPDGALFEAQP